MFDCFLIYFLLEFIVFRLVLVYKDFGIARLSCLSSFSFNNSSQSCRILDLGYLRNLWHRDFLSHRDFHVNLCKIWTSRVLEAFFMLFVVCPWKICIAILMSRGWSDDVLKARDCSRSRWYFALSLTRTLHRNKCHIEQWRSWNVT